MIEEQQTRFGDAYRILKTKLIQVRFGKDQGGFTRWVITHDHEEDVEETAMVIFAHPADPSDIIACVHSDANARVTDDRVIAWDDRGRMTEIKFLETRAKNKLPARLLLGGTT